MKKIISSFLLILMMLYMIGCNSTAVNEIYNKSYNVDINISEFEELMVATVEKVAPAVVGVSNYQKQNISLDMKLVGTGSGVVYSCLATMKNGSTVSNCETTINSNEVEKYTYYTVTNRHVVEKADMIKVYLGEERLKVNAELIQYDDKVDLAVVKFDTFKYIQPLTFADSDKIKRGSFAIAVGNPSGYDFYGSATFGIISYPKRYLADDTNGDNLADWDAEYIQHDVAINPGNSGGALVNVKGELIGINTLKLLSDEIDNMGFAIPSNVVKELVKILEVGTKPSRKTLGIKVIDVNVILNPEDYPDEVGENNYVIPEEITHGLYVTEIDPTKPAFNKLQVNDIITAINGVEVFFTYEFRGELNKVLPGETVTLSVFRNNSLTTVIIYF